MVNNSSGTHKLSNSVISMPSNLRIRILLTYSSTYLLSKDGAFHMWDCKVGGHTYLLKVSLCILKRDSHSAYSPIDESTGKLNIVHDNHRTTIIYTHSLMITFSVLRVKFWCIYEYDPNPKAHSSKLILPHLRTPANQSRSQNPGWPRKKSASSKSSP